MDQEKISLAIKGDPDAYLELLKGEASAIRWSILTATTPKEFVKQRKGKGGKTLDYVTVGYVTRCLNLAFGIDGWTFETEPVIQAEPKYIVVKGTLTVRFKKTTKDEEITNWITKENFGGAERFDGVESGDTFKSAASDALKKCASMFGIAGDIYKQTDLVDIEEPKSLNYNVAKAAIAKLTEDALTNLFTDEQIRSRIERARKMLQDAGYDDLLIKVNELEISLNNE